MTGEHVAAEASSDKGLGRDRIRVPWRSGTVLLVTLGAVARLVTQVGQDTSRADRDLDIFLQMFVAGVILVVLVVIGASWIVWAACRKVRRLRPDDVVFAAMVGTAFIQTVTEIAASTGSSAMPKYLWRPIISVSGTGVTVWFQWRRPRPGLILPASELAAIDVVTIRNPSVGRAGVPGMRLRLANRSPGTLDFTASRATPLAPVLETESKLRDLCARITAELWSR